MEVLGAMEDGNHKRRQLGENIMNHAESLLADNKISEGQYLDFCNGAGLIHQGVMMTQHEVATVIRTLNTMAMKVKYLQSQELTLRNHVNNLQNKSNDLNARYQKAKKAYARARTIIKDQKKLFISKRPRIYKRPRGAAPKDKHGNKKKWSEMTGEWREAEETI
jgi:outer membrane murein-binding lipoprotein Lpp